MCQAISPALYRKPALFNRPYREPLTTVRLNTVVVLLAPKITHVLHARPLCMSHTKQQSAAHSSGGYDGVKLYPTHAVCVLQWPQEDTSTCLHGYYRILTTKHNAAPLLLHQRGLLARFDNTVQWYWAGRTAECAMFNSNTPVPSHTYNIGPPVPLTRALVSTS